MTTTTPALWKLQALDLGRSKIRGPQAFWNDAWDQDVELAFVGMLALHDERSVLVNTSPPDTTEHIRKQFPGLRYLHEAPAGDLVRRPGQHMIDALAAHGLRPEDIDDVILTPLELYTTGTLHLFSNANIWISRRGWVHFHVTHEHPHDKRWRKFPQETLVDLVTSSWDRVHLLDDEAEIAPGLRTWWAGAHHRETMAVEFDTAAGVATVSDAFFYYANVEDGRLLGLNESMEETLAANQRALRTADHLVPIHEPLVFERYRGGRIGW